MTKAMMVAIAFMPPRELLLFALIREGTTTTKQLSEKTKLTRHETAKLCRNMVRLGYLIRRINGFAISPQLTGKVYEEQRYRNC